MATSFDRTWTAKTYGAVGMISATVGVTTADLGLRGHELFVPRQGGYEALDLRSASLSFGRQVAPVVNSVEGSILYLHSPTGLLRIVGEVSLLPDRYYTRPGGYECDLTLSRDHFEDLVATLEGLGLGPGRAQPPQAGYRDGRGAAADPLTIVLRRNLFNPLAGIVTGICTVLAVCGAAVLGRVVGIGPLVGAGAALALAVGAISGWVALSRRTIAGKTRRLTLVGREMHLQTADRATTLATVRPGELEVHCFSRKIRYQHSYGVDYLPVIQLAIPGLPRPVHFSTEDKRLSWGTVMDTRRDLGSYGFNLSAAEFLAVASVLGVADDLEFDAGYFERAS